MAYDANVTLKASGAVTDSTDGATTGLEINTTAHRGMVAVATVTAVSGTDTPTLALKVQESDNNSTFNDVAVFDNITATGVYKCRFASDKKYVRTFSTVTGTNPSLTYSVDVEL